MKVKITKLSSKKGRHPGMFHDGYWITGTLRETPSEGRSVHLDSVATDSNHNRERFQWFHTSAVVKATFHSKLPLDVTVETQNSVWQVQQQ